jgi:hypothetical protein
MVCSLNSGVVGEREIKEEPLIVNNFFRCFLDF